MRELVEAENDNFSWHIDLSKLELKGITDPADQLNLLPEDMKAPIQHLIKALYRMHVLKEDEGSIDIAI